MTHNKKLVQHSQLDDACHKVSFIKQHVKCLN